MATTAPVYCSVGDVADLLRVNINENTTPNTEMVRKVINRKEDEIDRRTGHSWRTIAYSKDEFDLPLIYTFGKGTPLHLKHRQIKDFDSGEGDMIEVWDGSAYNPLDITAGNFGSDYNVDTVKGIVYLRGFLFSILREKRIRITYRYGGDPEGDTIPGDIEDLCLKLTCIDLLRTSFTFDQLPIGGNNNIDLEDVINAWKQETDTIIANRAEVFVI